MVKFPQFESMEWKTQYYTTAELENIKYIINFNPANKMEEFNMTTTKHAACIQGLG